MNADLVRVVPAAGELASADNRISDATAQRIREGVPPNTRRAYGRQVRRFTEWCEDYGRNPLPATAGTLADYATALMDVGAGVPTIRQAIAAIRSHHALNGHIDQPLAWHARAALRGHARQRAADGIRPRQAIPVELDALTRMVETCDPDTYRGSRDRLLLILGWWGMLRRSELVALYPHDVTTTGSGHVQLVVGASKTDRDAKGAVVLLPPKRDPVVDPARAVAEYRRVLAAVEAEHGAGMLLRGVESDGAPGGPMSGDAANYAVKRAAREARLRDAERYSAHSLRAGGATAAYRAGTPVAQIAEHGRWASGSPVVLAYIRAVDRELHNAMRDVGT